MALSAGSPGGIRRVRLRGFRLTCLGFTGRRGNCRRGNSRRRRSCRSGFRRRCRRRVRQSRDDGGCLWDGRRRCRPPRRSGRCCRRVGCRCRGGEIGWGRLEDSGRRHRRNDGANARWRGGLVARADRQARRPRRCRVGCRDTMCCRHTNRSCGRRHRRGCDGIKVGPRRRVPMASHHLVTRVLPHGSSARPPDFGKNGVANRPRTPDCSDQHQPPGRGVEGHASALRCTNSVMSTC